MGRVTGFVLLFYIVVELGRDSQGFDLKNVRNWFQDGMDHFLRDARSPQDLEDIFGPDSVKNAVLYDENEDYAWNGSVGNKKIQFMLYTRDNMYIYNGTEIFLGSKETLLANGYDSKAPTKIISHGFNSDFVRGPGGKLMPAYFKADEGPMNIILLNWATMAGLHRSKPPADPNADGGRARQWYEIFYFPPARNTEYVGNATGALIQYLVQVMGASLDDMHLIGHSLGAHVMGYAGRFVQDHLQGGRVARITALDPAGPCFETWRFACFRGSYKSVGPTDGKFVDAIHTNAGRFGMKQAVGDLDFYPNSGNQQPGCPAWWKPTRRAICSHVRCIYLMKDSILYKKSQFLSLKCQDWDLFSQGHCPRRIVAVMGEECSPQYQAGIYYLRTGDREPYNVGVDTI